MSVNAKSYLDSILGKYVITSDGEYNLDLGEDREEFFYIFDLVVETKEKNIIRRNQKRSYKQTIYTIQCRAPIKGFDHTLDNNLYEIHNLVKDVFEMEESDMFFNYLDLGDEGFQLRYSQSKNFGINERVVEFHFRFKSDHIGGMWHPIFQVREADPNMKHAMLFFESGLKRGETEMKFELEPDV